MFSSVAAASNSVFIHFAKLTVSCAAFWAAFPGSQTIRVQHRSVLRDPVMHETL